MLTSDQLRIVLGSADHRRTYGLELPDASLKTLNTDPSQFTAFYDRWTEQGQPRYVPPVAAAAAPAAQAAPVAPVAPAAMPMPVPPMPVPVPPAPVATQFAPPPVPAPPGPMAFVALPSAVQPYVQPHPPNPYHTAAPFGSTAPFSSAVPHSSAMPYSPNMHNYVATPTGTRPGLAPMLIGFGIAAAGIIITIVTWEFAAPGGTFVVAWGSILFGSIRGVRGAMQFARGR